MELWSNDLSAGGPIAGEFAFCLPDEHSHARLGPNRNPHLAWAGAPPGTRSIALIVHDSDAPTKPDDVNQEGREVPTDLPRADFFHWLLVDLEPDVSEIDPGSFADGVVAGGRDGAEGPGGARQGINDYTDWFGGDPDMAGDYFGYDGPCPPWNDSLVHRYVFTVFALDVDHLDVPHRFDGVAARTAIEGHVLASAELAATYTLNPRLQ
jgi:Raf kinase inhibitor-like YbhB/YbcL family protein